MYVCRQSFLTWQESWPPFSCPAQRKISGINSCRPARRNIDLQQSLLTMGTDTCAHHMSLLHQFSTRVYCCLKCFWTCVHVASKTKQSVLHALAVRNCLWENFMSNTKNRSSLLAIFGCRLESSLFKWFRYIRHFVPCQIQVKAKLSLRPNIEPQTTDS